MTRRRSPSSPRHGASASPSSTLAPAASRARWLFALIAAAGLLTYANALGHPFVFDDAGSVVDNPTIRAIGSSLLGGPAQTATAGRPLVNITLALNYAAGGLSPWGYHLFNLGVHVGCGLLLFALLRRVFAWPNAAPWVAGRATGAAAAIALLWTVHPLNSEVVNYVTQRTEGLMALLLLATLYCGVRALDAAVPGRWHMASVAACAAGMTCKESMVVAPLLMLLTDATGTGTSVVAAIRRRPAYYAALATTWLLLALLVVEGPRWRSAGFSSGVSPWTYLLNQPGMILRYLRLAFVPAGLVLDYGEPVANTLAAVWPAALVVLALLTVTIAAWFVAPPLALLGTWFFLTLAPTSSILPIATEVGAERRMYLPLMALITLAVVAVMLALRRLETEPMRKTASRPAEAGHYAAGPQAGHYVARGTVAVVCVVLALLTVGRNREYSTTLGLWQTVVERWPNARAFYNLGVELQAAGLQAQAVESFQKALPGSADAHYALGFELQAQGKFDEALVQYREFLRLKPDDINAPRAWHQIGRTLLVQQKHDEAMQAFREVLSRKANDPDALAGIADTLLAQDKLTEAVGAYQAYLRVNPTSTDAMMNLGLTLVRLDRDGEARGIFADITQREPNNVQAHVNLAFAMANTNLLADSVREFRRAIELEKDPAARAEIEGFLAQLLGNH